MVQYRSLLQTIDLLNLKRAQFLTSCDFCRSLISRIWSKIASTPTTSALTCKFCSIIRSGKSPWKKRRHTERSSLAVPSFSLKTRISSAIASPLMSPVHRPSFCVKSLADKIFRMTFIPYESGPPPFTYLVYQVPIQPSDMCIEKILRKFTYRTCSRLLRAIDMIFLSPLPKLASIVESHVITSLVNSTTSFFALATFFAQEHQITLL